MGEGGVVSTSIFDAFANHKQQVAGDLAYTMCGSTEYMAPEALLGNPHSKKKEKKKRRKRKR